MIEDQTDLGNQIAEPSENMVPQSKVNEIVHARTKAAIEKARREAFEEASRNQTSTSQSMGGMHQVSPDEINRMIETKTQEVIKKQNDAYQDLVNQREAERVSNEFGQRILNGKNKYPDLDKHVANMRLENYPLLVHIALQHDNTADIMNDLAENPMKLFSLGLGAQTNYNAASEAVRKLSDSIKTNQNATNVKSAKEPLSQLSPSTVGTDNGSMTIQDFRRNPKYKV